MRLVPVPLSSPEYLCSVALYFTYIWYNHFLFLFLFFCSSLLRIWLPYAPNSIRRPHTHRQPFFFLCW